MFTSLSPQTLIMTAMMKNYASINFTPLTFAIVTVCMPVAAVCICEHCMHGCLKSYT